MKNTETSRAATSDSSWQEGGGIADLVRMAAQALSGTGNPTPALDARLLLQQAAEISHETVIADPKRVIAPDAVARFQVFLARRLAGEPVARILGEREFYGRAFKITQATLDPRPDTETLIEAALGFMPAHRACRIIDLGCGSGIIGVTLLAERPEAEAVMTDISPKALAVARENAGRYGILKRCTFHHGSWFADVEGRFDLILSNPPYIPRPILPTLAAEVRTFDPEIALVGGLDGLQAYREIAHRAASFLAARGHLIVEIGEGQATEITDVFSNHRLLAGGRWRDLAGQVRCLEFSQADP
jgi:release factor glutamine methyltransferase